MNNRVNTDVRIDPDFGTIVPPVEFTYWVMVKSKKKEVPSFRFILLMPIMHPDNQTEHVLNAVFQLIGKDVGDIVIKTFDHETYEKISKSTTIASFLPDDPETFIWLRCPVFLMH